MFKLISATTNGTFTIGKVYSVHHITERGHPVLIDDDGKEVDIWYHVSDEEGGFIPSCWGQG